MNKVNLASRFLIGLVSFIGILTQPAISGVRLPSVIGDHMVLQQRTKAPIWGWANPGEKVQVKASWDDSTGIASADENGHWKVSLKTPPAGGPFTIEISGENQIVLTDILVGEVWLCSGQSNMQMALNFPKPGYAKPVLNHLEEIRNADHPRLRLFHVPYKASDTPVEDCKASWHACSPETVGDFSAIGYFFGRELLEQLDVPIGMINASQGGSALESWTNPAVLAADKEYEHILKRYENALKNLPVTKAKYQEELDAWKKLSSEEQAKALRPMAPFGMLNFCAPSTLYNGMINPVLPFSIRGVLFYQGEENAIWPTNYEKLFAAMIRSWREAWGEPELAFFYCQLPGAGEPAKEPPDRQPQTDPLTQQYLEWHKTAGEPANMSSESWAKVQEAQLRTLRVPNTGMAVTIDIGDGGNGHPPNKQEVARRLALNALAQIYGKDVVYSGPIYDSLRIEGRRAVISFAKLQSPLTTRDGKPPVGFSVAGPDRVFHAAEARIEGDTVVVSSGEVPDPVAVRYGWATYAANSLVNEAGLPASPFRTDNWQESAKQ
ncbi:MAG TPA: sialate O-acetylesterase [Lacunisphaera sp.]|nr:sialate O-acetylesterase [Lacunisphaera sp.]